MCLDTHNLATLNPLNLDTHNFDINPSKRQIRQHGPSRKRGQYGFGLTQDAIPIRVRLRMRLCWAVGSIDIS